MRLTIDTNILKKAYAIKGEYSLECDSFIMGFYNNEEHMITFDYSGKIRKEYLNNLSENERFMKLYTALEYQQRFDFVSGNLDSKHKKVLINLGFHEPEDHVFVAVAFHSDRIIITEESDYGKGPSSKANDPKKQAVLAYLINTMTLQVLDSNEAKKVI
jgi:predicted nuclease of predicted toxin-antitoxin system